MTTNKNANIDILKSIVGTVKVPTTTLRGGQLILSADLARFNSIRIDGTVIHGENPAKVHPALSSIYKCLAVALCASPRSDRGTTLLQWVRENKPELEKIQDKVLEVELQGLEVKSTLKSLLEYAEASKNIEVKFSGQIRVRKGKEIADEEWEFV